MLPINIPPGCLASTQVSSGHYKYAIPGNLVKRSHYSTFDWSNENHHNETSQIISGHERKRLPNHANRHRHGNHFPHDWKSCHDTHRHWLDACLYQYCHRGGHCRTNFLSSLHVWNSNVPLDQLWLFPPRNMSSLCHLSVNSLSPLHHLSVICLSPDHGSVVIDYTV